jgi:7,8-dihydro-6-hydroxymethylpterin-pyrophosphokinase
MKYFLSLGSNIDAEKNLNFARKELNIILTNTKSSSIYKTKSEGFKGEIF